MMQPSLVAFDLDGTLIDSAGGIRRALNLLLRDLDLEPLTLDEVRARVGDGAAHLLQRAYALRDHTSPDIATDVRRFLAHYSTDPVAHTQLYPGVAETLRELQGRGITLAVCTNKSLQISEAIIAQLGIAHCFAAVFGGDSRPYRKPDPRILQDLLQQFSIRPERAVLVGDSEVDAATARAAGVPFILVTFGYHRGGLDGIPRDHAVDRFSELSTLLG